MSNKVNGKHPFTWPEVKHIRDQFFPEMDIEVLLSDTGDIGMFPAEGGERNMNEQSIKEALENQLQLLSKRSSECICDRDLAAMTDVMVNLANLLLSFQ